MVSQSYNEMFKITAIKMVLTDRILIFLND